MTDPETETTTYDPNSNDFKNKACVHYANNSTRFNLTSLEKKNNETY